MPVTKTWTARRSGGERLEQRDRQQRRRHRRPDQLAGQAQVHLELQLLRRPVELCDTREGLPQPVRHHPAADAQREVQLLHQLRLRPEPHSRYTVTMARFTTGQVAGSRTGRALRSRRVADHTRTPLWSAATSTSTTTRALRPGTARTCKPNTRRVHRHL